MHHFSVAVSRRCASIHQRPRTASSRLSVPTSRHLIRAVDIPPAARTWRVNRRVQLRCPCTAAGGPEQHSESVDTTGSVAVDASQNETAHEDVIAASNGSSKEAAEPLESNSISNVTTVVGDSEVTQVADQQQQQQQQQQMMKAEVHQTSRAEVSADATAAGAVDTTQEQPATSADTNTLPATAADSGAIAAIAAAPSTQVDSTHETLTDEKIADATAEFTADATADAAAAATAYAALDATLDAATDAAADAAVDAAAGTESESDSEYEDFAVPLDLTSDQQQQQQQEDEQQLSPPPLIDPDVDIANDPAYTIRLLDILDQISPSTTATFASSSSSSSSKLQGSIVSGSSTAAAAAAEGDNNQQQQQQQQQRYSTYSFIRQPGSFCTNCCTPLDPLRPKAPCSSCGHLPKNDTLLLNLGVSSEADLAAYPAWQQQQQQSSGGSGSNFVLDTKQLAQRLEAGMALKQAKQVLKDAGILSLPGTLLAYEDDLVDPEPAMQLHRGLLPPNHERPERLKVILARLRTAGLLDVCERLQPREASDEELLAVHSPGLISAVSALSHANQPSDLNHVAAHMAPDVLGNRYTYRAARLAAGTAAEMARQLVTGAASNGMALIRPMGHEAGVDTTEGGNYFNNVAVAARAAQAAGARRVMIIDWDIHHCKGTSEIFAEDPNVLVLSLHRYGSGFYPTTGAAEDVGVGRGAGRTLNVAWCPPVITNKRGKKIQVDAPPISDGDYITAWHMLVLPLVTEFRPDVVLVSAGFDAVEKDPLGYYRVHPECFGHLTSLLLPLAPLGLLLEGGYNLSATAAAVEACVRVLLGEKPQPMSGSRVAGVAGWSSILRTLLIHQQYWQSLGMLNFLQLATPIPEDDWEDDRELDHEEDDGYEDGYEVQEGEEEEEYELQEGEFEDALEAAAAAAAEDADAVAPDSAASAAAATAVDDPAVLLEQVLEILDDRTAAGRGSDPQQQQQQQQEDDTAAAAAAGSASEAAAAAAAGSEGAAAAAAAAGSEGAAAAAAGFTNTSNVFEQVRNLLDSQVSVVKNLPLGWGQQQQQQQQQEDATVSTASSSSSSSSPVNLLSQVKELVDQGVAAVKETTLRQQQQQQQQEQGGDGEAAAAAGAAGAAAAAQSVDNQPAKLLQQVRDLLTQPIAAVKDAAISQQQQQQQAAAPPKLLDQVRGLLDQRIAAASDIYADIKQQQQQQPSNIPSTSSNTSTTSSSSSSWSAGGFLEDLETVDSGTESEEDAAKWRHPSQAVDWGLEQYDEEVTDQLAWYEKSEAQKQLRRAEKAAAEAAAAEAAIEYEAAAAAAAEKGKGSVGSSEQQERTPAAAAAADDGGDWAKAAASDGLLHTAATAAVEGETISTATTPAAAAAAAAAMAVVDDDAGSTTTIKSAQGVVPATESDTVSSAPAPPAAAPAAAAAAAAHHSPQSSTTTADDRSTSSNSSSGRISGDFSSSSSSSSNAGYRGSMSSSSINSSHRQRDTRDDKAFSNFTGGAGASGAGSNDDSDNVSDDDSASDDCDD